MHSHVANADLPLQLITECTECFDCFRIAFIFEVLFQQVVCMHAAQVDLHVPQASIG